MEMIEDLVVESEGAENLLVAITLAMRGWNGPDKAGMALDCNNTLVVSHEFVSEPAPGTVKFLAPLGANGLLPLLIAWLAQPERWTGHHAPKTQDIDGDVKPGWRLTKGKSAKYRSCLFVLEPSFVYYGK